MVFPIALSDVRRGIDATDDAATAAVQGLDDSSVNWRPAAGQSWSIAQCLDHLSVAANIYTAAIAKALDGTPRAPGDGDPMIAPGRPSEWFIRQLEPPPRRRTKAPAKIAPADRRAPADVLERFHAVNRAVRQLIDRMGGVDPNRVRFPNPFLPLLRFTVGAGVLILLAHHRRHLWQAHGVRNTPGFPG
jgi:hypothetical protein